MLIVPGKYPNQIVNIWILKCINSLYSDFILYIPCCRVLFLTGNKTPFSTQVRVHHLLLNPARMGTGLTSVYRFAILLTFLCSCDVQKVSVLRFCCVCLHPLLNGLLLGKARWRSAAWHHLNCTWEFYNRQRECVRESNSHAMGISRMSRPKPISTSCTRWQLSPLA